MRLKLLVIVLMTIGTLQLSPAIADEPGNWAPPQAGTAWSGQDYSNNFLRTIATNTTNILQKVNNFPDYINTMMQYSINMLKGDTDSDYSFITSNQGNFATLGVQLSTLPSQQLAAQAQFMSVLYKQPITSFALPADDDKSILKNVPNVNDLSYSSLLGSPPATKGDSSGAGFNFVRASAGLDYTLPTPSPVWRGQAYEKQLYTSYYNSSMAIKSFDTYVLSRLYAESQAGTLSNTTQNALVAQASGSDWLAHVASEEIGKVLRHILVFESQSYVLLSQLVQTQKDLLTAQVMTNTLLMQNNYNNEAQMIAKAQGVQQR